MAQSKREIIQRVWDEVPSVNCKGLCQECCGPIICADEERAIVVEAGGDLTPHDVALGVMNRGTADIEIPSCPSLVDGRCSVYEVRPLICRLWGAEETMPCPHGCMPTTGRHMTRKRGMALTSRVMAIGGNPFRA